MSEYYDHYHRWEPLAEFHFNLDSDDDDYDEDNYLYCLCSRAYIRDALKFYYVDKECSESDAEAPKDSQSQPGEDHSHVHFSLDTSYKVKCEKDDGASCYCSASHTDNCCSTDEHDAAHMLSNSHALQPSDSGADLTYQDCHSDYTNHDKLECMDQDLPLTEHENYLSEATWDKFWAINGERLIWASWIKKYSDYINPTYLEENNDLLMEDSKLPKQRSVDQIYSESEKADSDSMRERKFSYDSKVNPCKKGLTLVTEKQDRTEYKDEVWLSAGRRRSCSEHDRIVSPRTLAGTDSMTNVTKMTMSSYDVSSSHVTSESSPTDDFSVSSSTSDDQSNDQTRIANVDNLEQDNVEEMDTDQYWGFLWKKHFGEQYALHYANYIEMFSEHDIPPIKVDTLTKELDLKKTVEKVQDKEIAKTLELEKVLDIEYENSEGNSQDLSSVIEVQSVVSQVEQIKIDDTHPTKKIRDLNKSQKYLGSVGVLLQNLLKQDTSVNLSDKQDEVTEAGDGQNDKNDREEPVAEKSNTNINVQSVGNNNLTAYYDGGDDDPPEETPINLKRSHEIVDHEETQAEKIKSTFEMMGFCVENNAIPKGSMVYRKRAGRLRPPSRFKKFGTPRKTYFDEDGNPVQEQDKESQDDKEMQTDDDCPDFGTQAIKMLNSLQQDANDEKEPTNQSQDDVAKTISYDNVNESTEINLSELMPYDVNYKVDAVEISDKNLVEASEIPLPSEAESGSENPEVKMEIAEHTVTPNVESSKRRRRQKRSAKVQEGSIASPPEELKDDPRMMKYWKRRHSLFHRFDEGIRLDRESWFSVTPENVARHIACKYTYDTVLDAFCGAGGNTIQFAFTCKKVIAIDIDPLKVEMAKHNAAVYGVADRIEFIVGDFFEVAPTVEADMVFLSPPWGGPNYSANAQYDIETMLQPKPATDLMSAARSISDTVYLYLPRNSRPDQILALAKDVGGSVEVEQSYLDKRFVAITAYFY